MKYSLILPIYNIAEFLERCFESIISQNFDNYEVILVNDGSTDSSGQICDRYAEKYDNFKVFHLENGGVSNARNFGLSKASGDYIWFLDADDYIVGQPLAELANKLDEHKPELVVFNYQDYNYISKKYKDKVVPFSGYADREKFRSNFAKLFRTDMFFTVWNKLYRREFLLDNSMKFEKSAYFGEDVVFNLDLYRKVNNVYFENTNYYIYIFGRPTSAANVYRKERLTIKQDEYRKVEKLCKDFGCEYGDLSKYMRTRIFINVANNIVDSNMSYNEKYKELKSLYEDEFFSGLLTYSNEYFNRRFKLTLVRGNIALFIRLKDINKFIKRIKK
ncbi:MAG: glycosyltransferase [Gemella sp.]|nr:glycosyltransferase [Gemella sp.]